MRRMIITAVATVSLAAPSAALAHNGEHHRAGERHHHHRGHHRHAHVLAFHAQAPASSTSTGASSPSSTSSTGDKAGTIASFTGGVLTIALNDGSTVSGKVTERTEIECPTPSVSASAADLSGHDGGDDSDFDDRGNDGSDDNGNDDNGNDGNGNDDNGNDAAEHCTSAALVPGASVSEAFLSVGGEGATWVKVEL